MFNNPIVKVIINVAGVFYWTLQLATMAVTGLICLIAGLINSLCIKIFGAHDYRLSLLCLWVLSGGIFLKLLGDGMANKLIHVATKGEETFDDIWTECINDFKKGLEED